MLPNLLQLEIGGNWVIRAWERRLSDSHFGTFWYHISSTPVKGASTFCYSVPPTEIFTIPLGRNQKKNASRLDHPKASSFKNIGNLAVLAAEALDPWFCVAIFR